MKDRITRLAACFGLDGEVSEVSAVGNGRIHATYDVTIRNNGADHRYIFQKMNLFVFKNPQQIMHNIALITAHVSRRATLADGTCDRVPHFHKTPNGDLCYADGQDVWRVADYVANTVTYNKCADLEKLKSAGRAFGEFQNLLSDFNAADLYETIPDFHNTRHRIAVLIRHVEEDPCGRAAQVTDEVDKVMAWRGMAERLNDLVDAQALPLRVTHNDTKINNLLFDSDTHEAKTVIDLDTVMPGLVAHDFGDAVRYAANSADEDERDLSQIRLDMDRFRAFAEGFVPAVTHALTPMETDTLALGAFVMTVELAVRFLDDYVTGDRYFKTAYPDHNLARARCQLALAEDMYRRMDEMKNMVAEIAAAPVA